MNWTDIGKQAIQMGAPILGGALGGPAGAAVGAMIANQFGIDTPTPANIMAAINDPLSVAGRRLQDAIRGQSMTETAVQPMGTLNLNLGGGSYPVSAPINVLSQLTTEVRRLQMRRPQ